jgi:hypothetical protein
MLELQERIIKEINNELFVGVGVLLEIYKLGNSDLIKSIEWEYRDNSFILLANDYFRWVNSGRRPFARKVPVEFLINWIKKKGLQPRGGITINSMAYAIQNGIYKNGIKARNFTEPIIEFSLETISEYILADFTVQIADEIVKEVEKINY